MLEKYYTFNREERQACAILAHLLMQEGRNLGSFLELVNGRVQGISYEIGDMSAAEVYIEFSFLRDQWFALGRDNEAKRKAILSRMSNIETLREFASQELPEAPAEFNRTFMGDRGSFIKRDIVYPGSWTVAALSRLADGEAFRDLCRLKWSFNIKPDLVIILPGQLPLVVEAKLESGEGHYPTSNRECAIFDAMAVSKVRQFELQVFMFERLLLQPCNAIIIQRDSNPDVDERFCWHEVFECLDLGTSISFVRKFVEDNARLGGRGAGLETGTALDGNNGEQVPLDAAPLLTSSLAQEEAEYDTNS